MALQTIQSVIKDTRSSQDSGTSNHHQLQQKHLKCHQSLREFLMPLNSTDFYQIFYISPSRHVQTIQSSSRMPATVRNIKIIINSSKNSRNIINLWGCSWCLQTHQISTNLQMSSIFEGVLDAFKLIGFQPNFKQSSLRAYADHP